MPDLSIGIPTYQRRELLKRCLLSIINQTNIDDFEIEILIGDDSKTSNVDLIRELRNEHSVPENVHIEYAHHEPPKRQNRNVGSLIDRANGAYFCLMHDDDFFLPGAISILLAKAMQNFHTIVFGKQVTFADEFNYAESDKINADFKRSNKYEGKQKDSVAMAMLQQCPNDGFVLPTIVAKAVGSRSEAEIGTACDFDFALRAAIEQRLDFYFINEYTTAYNISDDSVTSSFQNNAGERKLKILYEFNTNESHPKVFHEILKTDLSMVISHYIIVKDYSAAKKLLFSIDNFFKYLWYKPATYIQIGKIAFNL